MPSAAFSDTLAMVLVFVGGVLTGVLIWLLMRKYNRDHRRESPASRVVTPPTLSPETTAPIMGPYRKLDADHGTAVPVIVPPADETILPKAPAVRAVPAVPAVPVEPAVPSQPATLSPPVTQNTVADGEKATAPIEKQQSSRKEGADSKHRSTGGGGKARRGSTGGGFSAEVTKEHSKSEHRRRKTKKLDQKSPSPVDSGLSKRKSKHKHSKPQDSQAAREGPADAASKATAPAPAQEPSPPEQQTSPPQSQTSPPSDTGAVPAAGPATETHESVDPDVVKELRELVIKRRASHVSMHSVRQQRHIPAAPKLPAELDIFSEEHTSASVAEVTTPPLKSPGKRKRKTGKTVMVAASPLTTVAGSPGAVASSDSAGTTAVGSPVADACRSPTSAKGAADAAGPSLPTKDVDEPTLKELREMVIKRRASCMSVHSTKSGKHVPKPPPSLDIFSEEHSSAVTDEEPALRGKKAESKVKIFSEQPSLE